MDNVPYIRPQTPQALLHRVPDKPALNFLSKKPNKYIILLLAPTSVAGKVQIATSVAKALSCPLFQGDALHESNAKAAAVGASRSDDGGKGRYQRMWLRKMTRTGLLFPEESRPATEGFSGFGGRASSEASTSRRGSASSISSTASVSGDSTAESIAASDVSGGIQAITSADAFAPNQHINQPVFALSQEERRRKLNPALMVLTHPELEAWHRDAIREAVGEYDIGVIFVPLYETDDDQNHDETEEEELPVLRPLEPSAISGFVSFDAILAAAGGGGCGRGNMLKYGKGKEGNLEEEMILEIDTRADVEEIIGEVVAGVRDVMGV